MSFHIICADIIKHNKLISLQTILKILTFTAIKNNLFISYTPRKLYSNMSELIPPLRDFINELSNYA